MMKILLLALFIMMISPLVKSQVRTGGGPDRDITQEQIKEVELADALIKTMKSYFYESRHKCGNPVHLTAGEELGSLQFKLMMYGHKQEEIIRNMQSCVRNNEHAHDDYFSCLNTKECQKIVLAVADNELASVMVSGRRGNVKKSIFYQICSPK